MKKIILLALFIVPQFASGYDIEQNGIYYNVLSITNHTVEVVGCEKTYSGKAIIPNIITYGNIDFNVVSIADMAFECCSYKEFEIPTSVTSIGRKAFYGCKNLEIFTWPSNIEIMMYGMFAGCTNLKKVILPPTLKEIHGNNLYNYSGVDAEGAFEECSALEDVVLPESLELLDGSTFKRCSSLKHINIPQKITYIGIGVFALTGLESIVIPDQVTYISACAFDCCRQLKEVEISESSNLKGIGYWAFRMTNITHIDLPKDLENIDKYERFESVQTALPSSLKSLTLPNNDKTIKDGCYRELKLDKIYSRNETPQPISIENFNINTVLFATLYVPAGTIQKYKSTDGWKNFTNIEEGYPSSIDEIKTTSVIVQNHGGDLTVYGLNDGTQVKVYTLSGIEEGSAVCQSSQITISTNLCPGSIAIVKIGDKSIKVLMK